MPSSAPADDQWGASVEKEVDYLLYGRLIGSTYSTHRNRLDSAVIIGGLRLDIGWHIQHDRCLRCNRCAVGLAHVIGGILGADAHAGCVHRCGKEWLVDAEVGMTIR